MSKLKIALWSLLLFVIMVIVGNKLLWAIGALSNIAWYHATYPNYYLFLIFPSVLTISVFIVSSIVGFLVAKKLIKDASKEKKHNSTFLIIGLGLFIGISSAMFSVLSPYPGMPATCTASSGFLCLSGYKITSDGMVINVLNGLGDNISLSNATISPSFTDTGCKGVNICPKGETSCTDDSRTMNKGDKATIILYGCDFSGYDVFRGNIEFSYIEPSSNQEYIIVFRIGGVIKK